MRLLFIIHNIANCGAERVLALLVNELVNRGHEICILTNPHEVTYALDSRIQILDAYQCICKSKSSVKVMRVINAAYNNVIFYRTLRHTLHAYKPDCTVSFLGMFIWQLFFFRHKYRIIISDHSAMDRHVNFLRDYERRRLPEKFYRQTVLTEADKRFLDSYRTNIVVMYDPLTFKPISEHEYDTLFPRRKDILVCGSVERYKVKGIDNMIRTFAIIAQKHPETALNIAGAGSEEKINELKKLASELCIDDRVHFLGFRSDVQQLMKTHSLLAMSSRSEGFGMVLTEAMACGCPVVSYALSGPAEIIHHDVDGIIVENQNIEALAQAISKLLDNSEERLRLGRKAIESVERFSLHKIVDRWEKMIK